MALVRDDEIVVFNRQARVVAHFFFGLLPEGAVRFPQRGLFLGRVEFRLAAQHRIQALDRGDMDLADVVQQVGLQVLHVVQLAELAPVIRGDELVELFESLPSQVIAVHQEQHPPGFGEFDQPVDEIDRREGLAAAGRHLDQGPRPVLGEGALQILDGLHLGGPQVVGDQGMRFRHRAQACPQGIRLAQPLRQGLGPVEAEDPPGTRRGSRPSRK